MGKWTQLDLNNNKKVKKKKKRNTITGLGQNILTNVKIMALQNQTDWIQILRPLYTGCVFC